MTGHLIHIGYAKTGSTYLQRWFARHPQLGYAEGGVGGLSSVYQIAQQGARPQPGMLYRVTSNEAMATPHAYAGDIARIDYNQIGTSASQAAVCSMLADLFPNARILIVTRGFRSMILSSFSQYARSGGAEDFASMLKRPHDENVWNYNCLIGLYRQAFGEKQVIVMPYELLRDDAEAFIRALEAQLGLDHCPPMSERVNVSVSAAEMRWYPRLTRIMRRLPLENRFGRYIFRAYVSALIECRLRPVASLLELLAPTPGEPVSVDDDLLERFRGKAECLRAEPLYAPYLKDYLL